MRLEKTLTMTVDAVLMQRPDGKKDLKLEYILEEGKGRHHANYGHDITIIPYEQLLEIQNQKKRRSA